MKYKNNSRVSRRFYGITIKPGEIKEFPGYVNDYNMIRVTDSTPVQSKKISSASIRAKDSSENDKAKTSKAAETKSSSVKEEKESTVVEKEPVTIKASSTKQEDSKTQDDTKPGGEK